MTIEELENKLDNLILDADNHRGYYDPEDADYDRCDECHQSSYDRDYSGGDYFVDGKIEAYKEILKLLNKEND
jgi:hypothetical protein